MKGWKTAMLAIMQVIFGGLVGAGILTPDLGEQAATDVVAAVEAIEALVATVNIVIGGAALGVRHVTDSVAGWRK